MNAETDLQKYFVSSAACSDTTADGSTIWGRLAGQLCEALGLDSRSLVLLTHASCGEQPTCLIVFLDKGRTARTAGSEATSWLLEYNNRV